MGVCAFMISYVFQIDSVDLPATSFFSANAAATTTLSTTTYISPSRPTITPGTTTTTTAAAAIVIVEVMNAQTRVDSVENYFQPEYKVFV